jgi:hypothetical protein
MVYVIEITGGQTFGEEQASAFAEDGVLLPQAKILFRAIAQLDAHRKLA